MASDNEKVAELERAISAIQERLQSRYPEGHVALDVRLADLMPLLHARDAAEAKVASIGTVNPRAGGLLNSIVQSWKRLVSRVLDWHVREQVEFNRGAIDCVNSTLEALNDLNHALKELAERTAATQSELRHEIRNIYDRAEELHGEARELKDIRMHWQEWRKEWERKLSINEVQFLRSAADLQAAFNHRATLMEGNFRDIAKSQHSDFEAALHRSNLDVQQRLWADLDRIRTEYEGLIHHELRKVRQRAFLAPPTPQTQAPSQLGSDASDEFYDVLHFAEKFRGQEDRVRAGLELYVPYFKDARNVIELGCGRGEFLERMREFGVPARGVDLHDESIVMCKAKGLSVEKADMFAYLESQPDGEFDGVFCSQVIEHLKPADIPRLINLLSAKTAKGGVIAFETPNPECLAIFATHFYLDPTHVRPIPPALLSFYLEEAGFGRIEVHRISPAIETMPSIATLPESFREAFFGALDYAAIARKL